MSTEDYDANCLLTSIPLGVLLYCTTCSPRSGVCIGGTEWGITDALEPSFLATVYPCSEKPIVIYVSLGSVRRARMHSWIFVELKEWRDDTEHLVRIS